MDKSLYILKLGGSSITDKNKPYRARKSAIRSLAREIKKSGRGLNLIIAHGSGSFGHTSAAKFGGKHGYESRIGIATVSADAARINQIVIDIFVEEGLPVVSLSPMSMMVSKKGKLDSSFFTAIEEVLKQNLIPVVYGDVIWDKAWNSTIFSGEKTISEISLYLLTKGYKIRKVIELSETKGVYDLKGNTINRIDRKNFRKIGANFTKSGRIDVTGGMKHKIEIALDLSRKEGIDTLIISGRDPKDLEKALKNQEVEGTLVSL
jgi:isopentenyl phosphate kinase